VDPLSWVFFVEGMPLDPEVYETKSVGGSETAGLCVARALAKRGHTVYLFCRCPKEGLFYDRVHFIRVDRFLEWALKTPHDVTVIQRVPHPLTVPLLSGVRLWWMHDLALKRYGDPIRGVMWSVDRLLVLSEFMKRQYQEVYGLPDAAFTVTRNGVDLELIASVPPPVTVRDRKALVFTARPERGLEILLEQTFPRLLQKDPDLRLYLGGYDNYTDQLRPLYEKCHALINYFGGRVRHLGALNKKDLYKLYKTAALYIYPSSFEEISCISAMETMACGLPFVGSQLAALPETLHPDAGVLIPWEEGKGAADSVYQEKFVDACLHLLRDEAAWTRASQAGLLHAKGLDWDGVAEQWEQIVDTIGGENGTHA